MSTDLGAIAGRPNASSSSQGPGLHHEVHITRFYGGPDGPCIQITVGDQFVQLDGDGCAALAAKLITAPLVLAERSSTLPLR